LISDRSSTRVHKQGTKPLGMYSNDNYDGFDSVYFLLSVFFCFDVLTLLWRAGALATSFLSFLSDVSEWQSGGESSQLFSVEFKLILEAKNASLQSVLALTEG
jgi:hypothetical protein